MTIEVVLVCVVNYLFKVQNVILLENSTFSNNLKWACLEVPNVFSPEVLKGISLKKEQGGGTL